MKILLSAESEEDIKNIYRYFHVEVLDFEMGASIVQKIKYFLFTLLKENPEIGRIRDDICYRFTVRSFLVSSYVLFYYINNDEIHIIRVLHEKQDTNRYL